MAVTKKRTKTSLEIDTRIWNRIKVAAGREDLKLRNVVEESLTMWLNHRAGTRSLTA